eukprot:gene912-1773_t
MFKKTLLFLRISLCIQKQSTFNLKSNILKFSATTFGLFIPVEIAHSYENPTPYVQQGMSYFRQGDISASLKSFDTAIDKYPQIGEYLWQRGISLYYNGNFKECSTQFQIDIKKNPQDTEEIIWNLLCESQILRSSANNVYIKDKILKLPSPDPRPIMKTVYDVFRGNLDAIELQKIGDISGTISSNYFYSRLYLSLYYMNIESNIPLAQKYIQQALQGEYASYSNDYMISVAKAQSNLLNDFHVHYFDDQYLFTVNFVGAYFINIQEQDGESYDETIISTNASFADETLA